MRLKITLTLLVILLGLLTFIIYIDPWEDRLEMDPDDSNALGALAVDIDYLRISNRDSNRSLTLERLENGWMLTEPYRWPANAFAVERILVQLQFLDTKVSFDTDRLVQAGSVLSDYGLAPPELTLEFGSQGNRDTVGVGHATEVGEHLYLLSSDRSQIHVVDRSLVDSLSIDIEDLRNPRIFRSSIFEVDSWNLQLSPANNLRTRVTKNDEQWVFETPIRTRADTREVNTLLGKLLELKSLRILQPTPVDLALYGLEEPFLRIAMESDQTREALEIGNPVEPEQPSIRYAKLENRPTVFEMEIDYLPEVENAQTNLRDRRVFEIDTQFASSVSFERRGTEVFSLQKLEPDESKTDEWEILIPDVEQGLQRQKGSSQAVGTALEWLNQIKAVATSSTSGFIHDAPTAADLESYGLEFPEFSISVTSDRYKDKEETMQAPKTETLLIGDPTREDRSTRYVKLAEADFVYLVSNDILEMVPDDAFRYNDRQLFDFPDDAIVNRLTITRLSNGETILDSATDQGNLPMDLIRALTPITIKSYLYDNYTSNVTIAGKRQSWAYLLQATYQWTSVEEGQTETAELYISELTGGPFLVGGSIDVGAVFEFDQTFIDAFSTTVFNRVLREAPQEPFDPNIPLPDAQSEPANATVE